MARLTSIDRLSTEDRAAIAARRAAGATIDEIRAELGARGVKVSRSTLGRHTRRLDPDCELNQRVERLAMMMALDGADLEHELARLIAARPPLDHWEAALVALCRAALERAP